MRKIIFMLFLVLSPLLLMSCSNKISKVVVTTDIQVYKAESDLGKKIVLNNISTRSYNVAVYYGDEVVAEYSLITNSGYQYIVTKVGEYKTKATCVSRGVSYICESIVVF